MSANGNTLISIQDLKVYFELGGVSLLDRLTGSNYKKTVKAVDGVTLDIKKAKRWG